MPTKNAYRVLGLSNNSSADEIKDAYKRMALKWHPDRHKDNKAVATARFIEVNNAYRTLALERNFRPEMQPLPAIATHVDPPYVLAPGLTPQTTSTTTSSGSYVHSLETNTDLHSTPPSSFKSNMHSVPKRSQTSGKKLGVTSATSIPPPPRQDPKILPSYKLPNTPSTEPFSRVNVDPLLLPGYTMPELHKRQPPRVSASRVRHDRAPFSIIPPTSARPQGDINGMQFRSANKGPAPYALPLKSLGQGPSGEWAYLLPLTLWELFTGKHCRFGIIRHYLLPRKTKSVILEVDVPPGCRSGTRILCRGIGHERKDRTFQDIAFIIEELEHTQFSRLLDDLVMNVRLPWTDSLLQQGGDVEFEGLDGQKYFLHIEYPRDRLVKGRHVIAGAGMPVRTSGRVVGRGNLVVQWEILPPQTRILHFMRRFLYTKK